MLKNAPSDLQIETEKLYGFYRGVVEDNNDPLKVGRLRARIHGLHTEKKQKSETEGIPTNELPWAEPCLSITEGSVSGFGVWSVPLQGSHVMLFFENGNPTQPRYFASMPGIPEEKESYSNTTKQTSNKDGFKDPNNEYPTQQRLGESDYHRLSRGESEGTLVETKNEQRDLGVSKALGGAWDEPVSPFNARYPHNHVIATHGGITIELDSTPGSTRLHLYHPSNSFIEIDNDGQMVIKNNAGRYDIIADNNNIHIQNNRNITIDNDSRKKVGNNEHIEVEVDKNIQIGNDKNEDIGNDETVTVGNDETVTIGNDKTVTVGNDKIENIVADEEVTIGGNRTESITGNEVKSISGNHGKNITLNKTEIIGGSLTVTVGGNINLTSTGSVTVNGGSVQIIGSTIGFTGTVSCADQGSLLRLVNENFVALFNAHRHLDPQGGYTFFPNIVMTDAHLTANMQSS